MKGCGSTEEEAIDSLLWWKSVKASYRKYYLTGPWKRVIFQMWERKEKAWHREEVAEGRHVNTGCE